MAVLKATPSGYFLWDYVPSRTAAIVAAILFFLGTLAVIWQSVRTRTKFAIPFVVGGIFQIVGYVARALAQDATDALPPFIVQYILILVAPALFAASIYMVLGRVICSTHGERHSVVRPSRLTRTFVWGDVISFVTQVAGGSLQSVKKFDKTTAERIVLCGLIFQVIIFGIFAVVAVIWHRRMRKQPTAIPLANAKSRWESIMFMLYTVSILIMVRSVFRIIEYAMGRSSYLLQNEWTMYIFDTALMVITVLVFAWWYPGLLHVPEMAPKGEMGYVVVGTTSDDHA